MQENYAIGSNVDAIFFFKFTSLVTATWRRGEFVSGRKQCNVHISYAREIHKLPGADNCIYGITLC